MYFRIYSFIQQKNISSTYYVQDSKQGMSYI